MHALKYRKLEDDPRREIEMLQAACHPNVVELLQFYPPYLHRRATVLAFLGADCGLSDVLHRRVGLGPDEQLSDSTRRGVAVQLLAALGHVHSRRMIHRDVKPANILLRFGEPLEICRTASGEQIPCYLRMQLADFSRARWLPISNPWLRRRGVAPFFERQSVVRQEVLSTRLTTAVYLAPEVASKARCSKSVDIWAFVGTDARSEVQEG